MSELVKSSCIAAVCLSVAAAFPVAAEDVSAECRGVAAGVVAAMRAADELATDAEVAVAIVAARRACSAALTDLVQQGATATTDTAAAVAPEKAEKDEPSVWDLLTRDRELKPGNERLRRLKTQ